MARLNGGIAIDLLAATPACRRSIPVDLRVEPDRQRAAGLERFIIGWPVPSYVGRGGCSETQATTLDLKDESLT